MMQRVAILLAGLLLASPAVGMAAEPSPQQIQFFETKIRPVLAEHCYSCHSEAKKKDKGGLVLDSLAGLLQGGDSGPALVPGLPEKSRLIEAIRYANEDMQMPPKGKLSDAAIADLTRWVQEGAPWPGAKAHKPARVIEKITDEDRQWWAFQPVRAVTPPAAGMTWARNPIDHFIAAKHAEAGLQPAQEAPRAVLIRRVYFDLWGIPPTPEEIEAFVADPAPDAYEKLVDRLLASPRYGERWARHWLDLVRYADSDGYRLDEYRPHSWRYRDYVVNALNNDKPYDRFIREQLAGDELYPGDPEALVATGYLRHWIYEYNQRDVRTQWDLIVTDVTDTTGDVFLGLGLQCARCHDHKFDPILQKDYFRLRAFFENLLPREDLAAATQAEIEAYEAKLKIWEEKTAAIRAEIDALEKPYRARAEKKAVIMFPEDIQAMIRTPQPMRDPQSHQLAELAYRQVYFEYGRLEASIKGEDKERYLALKRKLAEFDALKPAPLPVAYAATDVGPEAPPTVIPKKGITVEPGYLTLLDEKPAAITPLPDSSGRRSALANWLTQPENPLTARVLVNRLWQQHFGKGLAANASDFGKLGELPTHPELLDWLAREFVAPTQGANTQPWSMKHMHRLMVTSATYRQSADHPEMAAGRLKDPENHLLWRGSVRRLDAEQIRDALFAVTGELNLQKAGGPGTPGTEPRRSIYTKVLRNTRDPLLDVFDAPLWFNSASARDTTTTPVQSLYLFNGQMLLQRSRALANRAIKEVEDDEQRVDRLYRLVFGRAPTSEEREAALTFVREQERTIDVKKAGSAAAAFVAGKIPYRDGQAAEVTLGKHPGFHVPHAPTMPTGDFTIEAFIFPRTIADSGAVRTIVAKWNGSTKNPGWGFGITGKQSRRKPQTVVMQMIGKKRNGTVGEEAIFSDQHIQLNKPYYLAASVKLATPKARGEVTFYLKDLANDDEPLLVARVPHEIESGVENDLPLMLGARMGGSGFDGLIDDIRLSKGALGVSQLLFTTEGVQKQTVGYWQFEAKPNVFSNTVGSDLEIRPATPTPAAARDATRTAWSDLCHILLNASEFLYVQ